MDKKIKEYIAIRDKFDLEIDALIDLVEEYKSMDKDKYINAKETLEKKETEYNEFVNLFAKYVFDLYAEKKPILVDNHRKKHSWDEVYGDDFNKVTKLRRETLTSLFDKDGYYKLK